jgi:hypothetical protein
MTTNTTDPQTTTDHPLQRGRTFRHWGGTWTLVAPATDAADSWVAVNPDTHAKAILTVLDVVWTGQTLDDDQLAVEITTAWRALHQRWERVQARLAEKEQMITDIRQYAIDRHLEGAFCRDGLNTALRHFDLEPYQPRYQGPRHRPRHRAHHRRRRRRRPTAGQVPHRRDRLLRRHRRRRGRSHPRRHPDRRPRDRLGPHTSIRPGEQPGLRHVRVRRQPAAASRHARLRARRAAR